MFDIGGGELIVIILAIILLFGPKKIPEIMKALGTGISKIRQAQSELKHQINEIEREVSEVSKEVGARLDEEKENN